jgi:predicted metal-binding membrane protein
MKKIVLSAALVFLTINTASALVPEPGNSIAVPTFSPWGMIITGLLLGAAGVYTFFRKK